MKVMLAPNKILGKDKKLEDINYPVLVSPKMDGIRCYTGENELLSRSNKPIRNKNIQAMYDTICGQGVVLDGELYSHEMTFQEITSVVMSSDKEVPDSLKFHVFDCVVDEPFKDRLELASKMNVFPGLVFVQNVMVYNSEALNLTFEYMLSLDYEGAIVRDPNGRYKQGRATLNEGIIYKMKPYNDYDGRIIGVEERMENTSESYTNELGRSQKHRCKDDMVPTGIASAFVVETEDWGTQKISLTGIEAFRRDVWEKRESMVGRWIKFKAMSLGAKDSLRHPTFLSFRDDK